MEGIEVCPKCSARLIEEEAELHTCDLDYQIRGGKLFVRNERGFWERVPLPFALPDETLHRDNRRGLDRAILWALVTWLRNKASSAIPLNNPPVVCVTFSFLDPYPCPHHDSFILASAFWMPCYHKLIG